MKCKSPLLYLFCFFLLTHLFTPMSAQYFVDIVSVNSQLYRAVPLNGGLTQEAVNSWVNVSIPIVRPSGNTWIVRCSGEQLALSNSTSSWRARSITLPIGLQWKSRHPRWKHTAMVIPKVAGTTTLGQSDQWQGGAFFLSQVTISDSLRVKMGLYVNKEFFGMMYIPMLGIDWKINERWVLYGTLPNFLRLSYAVVPGFCNTGVGFKSLVRSFRGNTSAEYIRYNEIQCKYFLEFILGKNGVAFAELGYFMGKAPLLHLNGLDKNSYVQNDLLTPMKPFPMVNFGLAFRVFQ